jgi:oligosaccharide reducing-end xylanase
LFAAAGPGDGSGAYLVGKYRNLFAEDGHSQREIHAKVDASFKQLFHGDPQMRRSRLRPAATPMGR